MRIYTALALSLVFGFWQLAVTAAPLRSEVLSVLDRIPNGHSQAGFKAWVNDGASNQFTLGERIEFNFSATSDVYVSIAYVDNQGILSLLQPEFSAAGNFLKGGTTGSFPPPNSGMEILIEPPLGVENIFFVATAKPIGASVFETAANTGGDQSALFRAEDSLRLAQDFLVSLNSSNQSAEIASTSVSNTIVSRSRGLQYTPRDIVGYFSKRGSRSISRPKLDADIQFESNSDQLTEEARKNLDVWGESLMHPFLEDSQFEIGGHTDDVGSEGYNLDLSARRAASVNTYLQSKFGIPPNRLKINAHGESAPKEDADTREARAANRRVEFLQMND